MKPIAIFRHSPSEGAGYFATYLDAHSLPWELIAIDAAVPPPPTSAAYSGICFMGGPMSVNDDLPWIPPVLELIREAVRLNIPVIGHCLGGQLISKALGGIVNRNPVKEIGWGRISKVDSSCSNDWLGDITDVLAFHWHGETFSIPQGAERLLESPYCANQAFALGPHLAMQCHVEMTPEMIREWCRIGADEIASVCGSPSVDEADAMLADVDAKVAGLRKIADQLYGRWVAGLKRD